MTNCFHLGEVTRECTEYGQWKVPAYNCIRPALDRLQKQVSSWVQYLILNRNESQYSVSKQQKECEFSPPVTFLLTVPRQYFFVDHLCYLCLVFFILVRLFIAVLWSPAGKGLTS